MHDETYVHMCLWTIRSTGRYGGGIMVHPKQVPRSGNCARYDRGVGFSGDSGSAVTWSSGFELGASLGIKGVDLKATFSGSARTGYDQNARMSFKFGRTGYMCGTNGPISTAAILVQRPL
jgi:hypothetical protein